jgi:4-hydroxy-tetrahydrodipicolinate reductase
MGRTLIEATLHDAEATLVAAFDQPGAAAEGKDAGEMVGMPCGVPVSSDCDAGIARASCLIDFTRPEATLRHLAICRRYGVAMVIGTTGFDGAGKEAIAAAAQDIPLVFAPNMSVGVNVVFKLLDLASRILGEGYDVEIVEAHHRHKIDAPSGRRCAWEKWWRRRSAGISKNAPFSRARASPANACRRASVLPPCAEATSSAITT